MPTRDDLIWLAGFIDGEGCFLLTLDRGSANSPKRITSRIQIVNTHTCRR